MKRENTAFRDRSKYPEKLLFAPYAMRLKRFAAAPIIRRLGSILEPDIPPTRQDAEYARKTGYPPRTSLHNDVEIGDLGAWRREGACWVRERDGDHPGSITSDREGAHALWRNHAKAYCPHGRPCFSPEQIAEMQKGTEVFKPLLRVACAGDARALEISLARSIGGPTDTSWGLSTLKQWLELRAAGVQVGGEIPARRPWSRLGKLLSGLHKLQQARAGGQGYCAEYLSYCEAEGRPPDEQRAHDRERWPGGHGCGFILWLGAALRAFREAHPECHIGSSVADHEAKNIFLAEYAKRGPMEHPEPAAP